MKIEDNKYIEFVNYSPDDDDRKMARKKKKRWAKVKAVLLILVLIGLVAGGVLYLPKIIEKQKPVEVPQVVASTSDGEEVVADEIRDVLDNLTDDEEEIVVTEPEEPEPTAAELNDAMLTERINEMTLEEKVMGLFIVRPEQITGVGKVVQAGDGTKEAVSKYPVGGILYSSQNIVSKEQFKEMITNTKGFVKYPTFFVLHEELGNTVLAKALSLAATRSESKLGETMDPFQASVDSAVVATYLSEYGINLNLGLIGDTVSEGDETSLMGERSFGSDPVVVSRMVYESIGAFKAKDVPVAMGMFPGQGQIDNNPSETVANTPISKEDLQKDYTIYVSAVEAGLSAIVVSHEYAENITSDKMPCSLSKEIYTDIIREEMGLSDVILITDELDKAAISQYYTSAEACVTALKAGADMLMCPENLDEAFEAILEAIKTGVISEERINDALKRIYRIKLCNELLTE